EAMASGLPVVATTRCAGVVTDGADRLVIPPADSNALANALNRFVGDSTFLEA
ncbi:MAG: glycosyltransferase, partial [Chromatiales bacterium]|nr:glycosyltransferase [Chromatiales bacterium]